ncbi:MAG: extracellular solute-binding protein [Wenzhouxiangellaceae bacterium]|nr:extracellular solute-binding protein [Wenzhouxiangellaceae bacterium]MBS3746439.1 extracellular solute-binding protein [Wenzhouxiangellaceae bacterium]MBS3823172.1 extracellular solute-binding protein [Wenzhouxiangellaceae bacterium]
MDSERTRRIRRMAVVPLCFVGLAMLAQAAAEQLTVVSWGGVYTRSQILGFVRDFEQSSGIDVEMIDYTGGIEEIRSQVRAYNIKWNVVDLELFDAMRACDEGLLVEIDPASLPPAPDGTAATEDFVDGALTRCAVGNVAFATVIAYDRDRLERGPETIEDFFDLRGFPGKRGLRRTPMTNLEWALISDGVESARVYDVLDTEEGVDRAFAVLDRIKPQIEWWELGEEAVRLLETDSVAMTSAYNGRIHSAAQRGEPFEILWDHNVRFWDVWGIPKHTENLDAALAFVRFATSTRSLANQSEHIAYGPLRKSSLRLLDSETRENLPTADKNAASGFATNAQWWGEHLPELQIRFDRWLERSVNVPKDLPGR